MSSKFENETQPKSLSRKQLMWRKFKRNRLAILGSFIVGIMYFSIIFPNFITPYPFNEKNESYVEAPPQKIRLFDKENPFKIRPYVYDLKKELDPVTYRRTYIEDKSEKNYIYFFNRGYEYNLLGLIPTNIHLFGTGNDSPIYVLGTDRFGRDMLSRILYGGRISLSIGLLGVLISVIIGSLMGAISGYFGGTIDLLIQRLVEFLRSFPRIPLWMTLSAALPADWSSIKIYFGIVIILGIIGWVGLCRAVRGIIISFREEECILAAEAAGASHMWIITRHLVPRAASHIIVSATLRIPAMILGEAALSFLGLGIQPPMTSWGVLLQEVQNVQSLAHTPWLFLPAVFMIITILGFNFFGDGLRDAADPFSQ